MSFPRYPEYKDSGVAWLGEVPEHWSLNQGRRLFTQEREPTRPADDQLSATQKYGVVPQKLFMEMEDQKVALALNGLNSFKHVEAGDFVISLRSFQGGIERSAYSGCVSPAYTVLRPAEPIDGRFWSYLLKSKGYIEALQSMTDGIRDGKNISYQQFGQIIVPTIPLPEQTQIAAFLDRETAKIDALVAEQQRLMELLKEKRQAVISHAVTQGLNPNAPMKPSGIEWLGDVPAHWEIKPLKHVGSIVSGFAFSSSDFTSSGIRVLKIANIQTFRIDWSDDSYLPKRFFDQHPRFVVKNGDVVFALTRPIISTGLKAAVVDIGSDLVLLNQRNALFRPFDGFSKHFVYHVLFSGSFIVAFENKIDFTGQQPNISPIDIGNIKIPIPPFSEQVAIANDLESVSTHYDTLTAEAQRAIDLLQERRTALISAAVTGQIDVRPFTEQEAA